MQKINAMPPIVFEILKFKKNLQSDWPRAFLHLKVQSWRLYNSKYMIDSTEITNTEIFAIIAFLAFKLLRLKVSFIYRKDNTNF